MTLNVDYTNALVGASPQRLMAVATQLAEADVQSPADLRQVGQIARTLGAAMQAKARENVDIASKAGDLPTRYLGIDTARQFPAGVPAGATNVVNVNPSVDVRITGFRTDGAFANDFSITEINVATIDLIVGQDACPASMFTDGISLPPVSAPRLPGGSAANIGWLNVSGAARRGRGGFPILKLTNPNC